MKKYIVELHRTQVAFKHVEATGSQAAGDAAAAKATDADFRNHGSPSVAGMSEYVEQPPSPEEVSKKLLSALREAREYVERSYECAFPDSAANQNVLEEVDAAIALAEKTLAKS